MRRTVVAFVVATLAAFGLTVAAVPATAVSTDVNVPGTAGGPDNGGTAAVSTGIVIPEGASVTINASGTVSLCGNPATCDNDPDGGVPGNSTPNSLVPSSPYGCLAARVGSGSWQCIGSSGVLDGPGEIQFGINDDFVSPGVGYEDNSGSYTVVVGQPTRNVFVTVELTGDDPGVPIQVTVTCTTESVPELTSADLVVDNRAGEMVLGADDTRSITFTAFPVRPGSILIEGPQYVKVWWPVSGIENVTCTVSQSIAGLPAGATCATAISPDRVVLYDLNEEIDQNGSFGITNQCSLPIEPKFTG
jgi:hypothetical protein